MNSFRADGYEQSYSITQITATKLSAEEMTVALKTLMSRKYKTESTWGAIDALADTINKTDL